MRDKRHGSFSTMKWDAMYMGDGNLLLMMGWVYCMRGVWCSGVFVRMENGNLNMILIFFLKL